MRRLPEAVRNAEQHRWDQSGATAIGTLHGATVAVVGFGNIGREVAMRLGGIGAHVDRGDAQRLAEIRSRTRWSPTDRLHEALAGADAVVVAVPLNAQTRHLIDARALAALRPHALLINIARGGVVDQAALTTALTRRPAGRRRAST